MLLPLLLLLLLLGGLLWLLLKLLLLLLIELKLLLQVWRVPLGGERGGRKGRIHRRDPRMSSMSWRRYLMRGGIRAKSG